MSASGESCAEPGGSSISLRLEERADPVATRLAVDVLLVVVREHELAKRLTGPAVPASEELVEHLLPRARVDLGGLGQDAVEVEQAGGDAVRQVEHGRKLPEPAVSRQAVFGYLRSGQRRRARPPPLALDAHVLGAQRRRRRGSRRPSSASSSACRPALRATRNSGPSLQPPVADRGAQLDHDVGLAGEAGQQRPSARPSTEARAARWRRAAAAARSAATAGLASCSARPRRPPRRSARNGRSAGRRCRSSRGPCGRRGRARARSSRRRARPRRSASALPNTSSSTDASRSSSVANIIGSPFLVRIRLVCGDHPADRDPVAVAAAGQLGQRAVDRRAQRGADLLERVGGDEQPDRLLLGRQQLGAVELDRRDRRVARGRERRSRRSAATSPPVGRGGSAGIEVEDRALADQRVLLGLLARALGLLEHRQHALAGGAGRAERAALDQRLDRLLVDRAAVDARAEVEQVEERTRAGGSSNHRGRA